VGWRTPLLAPAALAAAALLSGCPRPPPQRPSEQLAASGEVPYPTDFTPPPPLPPPDPPEPRQVGLAYLELVGPRIASGWHAFLEDCRLRLPPSHPLNSPTLAATLGLVIDEHGQLVDVTMVTASGSQDFDEAALAVVGDAGPFPAPDRAALSDDGSVYLRWLLARDRRQAGVATARLDRIEWSLDRAIPHFVAGGDLAEAARRLTAAAGAADALDRPRVTELAAQLMAGAVREGLGSADVGVQRLAIEAAADGRVAGAAPALRSIATGALDVGQRGAAIVALAAIGDRDAVESLAAVLATDQGANVELTGGAARALVALGAGERVARQVGAWLAAGKAGKDAAARTATWAALVTGAAVAVPTAAADWRRLAGERDLAMRGAACRAMGSLPADGTAWPVMRRGLADPDASVRATCSQAIAAAARAGGRSDAATKLVVVLLRDRDERVRAAAVVALAALDATRAGKELPALAGDRSPAVQAALAGAWGGLPGPAAFARLGELAGHPQPVVRAAVIAALAARGDDSSQERLRALAGDPEPALRAQALSALRDRATLEAAANDPDPVVRAAAAARVVKVRGRADSLVDVASAIAASPPSSPERVRLAGAWLASPP
jgi:TonB family protein